MDKRYYLYEYNDRLDAYINKRFEDLSQLQDFVEKQVIFLLSKYSLTDTKTSKEIPLNKLFNVDLYLEENNLKD